MENLLEQAAKLGWRGYNPCSPGEPEDQAQEFLDEVNQKPLTIESLLNRLCRIAAKSPLGAKTVVCLCEEDREYIHFVGTSLDKDDSGGAVALIKVS